MTCKDCLHYEACVKHYTQGQLTMINGDCSTFTDRSEWVHLPCKVGDKIYQTDGIRIYESTIREIEISSASTVYCTENIAFDERAIGHSIFLTREEVEKASEGYKENSEKENKV